MFPGRVPSVQQIIRTLRILQGALFVAAVCYVVLPEYILREHPKPPKEVDHFAYTAIALVSVATAATGFFLGRWLVGRSERKLLTRADERTAVMGLYMGYLIGMCISSSIVLYGLALRFTGATFSQVAPFYAGGIVLLLLFTPRRPSPET